jgi:hypothetical protein
MLTEKAHLYIEQGIQAQSFLSEWSEEDLRRLSDVDSESPLRPLVSSFEHFNGVQLDFLHVVAGFDAASRLVAEWEAPLHHVLPRIQTDSVRTQI